jgi:Na+-translocating ferredoxin:NAD+ oxidoreductase RnfD subunit
MDELKEFRDLVASIKSDRQAQKEKESRDSWTRYVSLSMIFIAVLAAVASQKSGGFSSTVMQQLNEATFNQAAASDQWSLYQAKGIKQSLAEEGLDALRLSGSKDEGRLADLAAKARRYDSEKKAVMRDATALEARRDAARALAQRASNLGHEMGLASTLFQVGIAIGGVCLIVKKRWLWWVSLMLGAAATLQMIRVLFWQ